MVRRQRHSHNVSRLTGMYFFADFSEAKVAESWGDISGRRILESLNSHHVASDTVDSNWITYAPRDPEGRLRASDLSWIDRYWAGEAHDNGPVWETIVDGRAIVLGTQLRQRAYKCRERFPDALNTLQLSRLAAAVDADLGQVTALMRRRRQQYRIDYSPRYASRREPCISWSTCEARRPEELSEYRRFAKETFGLPDFRPFSCEFTVLHRPIQAGQDVLDSAGG